MAKLVSVNTGHIVDVPDNSSIKGVCEDEFGVEFGCENGVCATCRITVSQGNENLNPKNEKEEEVFPEEPETRLACQCQIKEGVVMIDTSED
ncbi:ferredoxin [Candidatus Pacearchaeota archaeon]|nr:ferredoxin [Candidatus Pacearchaeota archaeon]|tara:strand:+ start:43 stop:318 length:276 start_codon:yes stop_codon:yes gene_type:complete